MAMTQHVQCRTPRVALRLYCPNEYAAISIFDFLANNCDALSVIFAAAGAAIVAFKFI